MMEPPGFLVHAWSQTRQVASHLVFVGKFEGPYPFHDERALTD